MARRLELEGRMVAVLDTARNRAVPGFRHGLAGVAVLLVLTIPVAGAAITPRLHVLDGLELNDAAGDRFREDTQAGRQRPAFDVASIRRTPDDTGPGADFARTAGGRLRARNNSVENLIVNAYGVPNYLVVAGPEWVRADRYDLEARAPGEASTPEMMLMLQVLLEDRFQLRMHREMREMPAYVLTVARGGARLVSSRDGGCTAASEAPTSPMPQSAGTPLPRCGNNLLSGRVRPPFLQWTATRIDMNTVTKILAGVFRRPVLDRTGLSGFYDIDIELPPLQPIVAPDQGGLDTPSLFSVLQEKLGLRVEEGRGPVEVLVIDRIERPTEN